jgi:hypothetical protein
MIKSGDGSRTSFRQKKCRWKALVRGSLLIAVMIHVIQTASTRDYNSEVDTFSHEAQHLLVKRIHDISQTAFSGVTSEPHVMI